MFVDQELLWQATSRQGMWWMAPTILAADTSKPATSVSPSITGMSVTPSGREATREGMPEKDLHHHHHHHHHHHPTPKLPGRASSSSSYSKGYSSKGRSERPWEEAVEFEGAMYTKLTYCDGRVEWQAW